MNTDENDSAYPIPVMNADFQTGLTKREYFAAMAMQGMIAANNERMHVDMRAEFAVMYADALKELAIKALQKTHEKNLAKANEAFGDAKMNSEQIANEYNANEEKINAAIEWVKAKDE